MRFGSVCSGIEAASVAWNPLGWEAAWFSEIEPFPCAVLAHHYPLVPNLGDMTALPEMIGSGAIEAPDVLCGGTPCQAFSVAGLRRSLDDARGNLSLVFCEIANAIDAVRAARGENPSIIFWENVPGVLNTKDNAFGCFLAGLAGEDDPLVAPGGKWTNAGYVLGPKRAVAWRVLDAQYFGVAQRRRRVFVVASARDGFDPAAVLFEFDGVRRDTPPSREAGEGAAGTLASRTDGGGFHGTDEACSGYVQPAVSVCPTLRAGGNRTGGDRPPSTDVDTADSLLPTYAIQAGALRTNPASGPDGIGVQEGHAYTLEARAEVQAVCIAGQVTHTLKAEGFDASEDGTGRGTPIICCHGTQDPCVSEHTAFALGRNNGGGGDKAHVLAPVAVQASQSGVLFNDTVGTLDANYGSRRHNGVMQAMQVRRLTPVECERLQGFKDNYTNIPWTEYQRMQRKAAKDGTSFEAELRKRGKELRGQPVGECPDGPRYKALGNSWAVPNVRWIGKRIAAAVNAENRKIREVA